MEHTYRAAFRVHQDNRQAVCGQNCEQEPGGLRDQAVAGETGFRRLRNTVNKVRMNLSQGNERPREAFPGGPDLREKDSPEEFRTILFHRPPRILPGEAKIQALPAVNPGNSSQPGAEAMDEPGNGRERIGAKYFALGFPEGFQRH